MGDISVRKFAGVVSGSPVTWPWNTPAPAGVTGVYLLPRTEKRRRKRVIGEFAWGRSDGANGAPPGLTYTRTGTIVVPTIADASIVAARGANVWSPSVLDDPEAVYAQGVLVGWSWPGHTNLLTNPRAVNTAPWTGNTATDNGSVTAPDGSSDGRDYTASTITDGPYQILSAAAINNGDIITASLWERSGTGATTISEHEFASGVGTITSLGGSGLTTTYRYRARNLIVEDDTSTYLRLVGSVNAVAQRVRVALPQVARLPYAPPYTDTTAGATRYRYPGARFFRGGSGVRFDVVLTEQMLHNVGSDYYDGTGNKAWFAWWEQDSGDSGLRYNPDTGELELVFNDVVQCSTPTSWSDDDGFPHVYFWNKSSGCGFEIGGGGFTGTCSASGAAYNDGVATPSTVELLSGAGADHVHAIMYKDFVAYETA